MKRLILALAFMLLCAMPAMAQQMSPAEFERMMMLALKKNPALLTEALSTQEGRAAFVDMARAVFKDHPALVLDVLKDHEDLVFSYAQNGAMLQKRRALAARWVEDAKFPKKIDVRNRIVRGNAEAPVTLVVYSDFTCGYCRQASKVIAELQKDMPDAFRYVFKLRPAKNPAAVLAAEWFAAAALQDQKKAWDFYAILFNGQSELATDPSGFLTRAAQQAGLDVELLRSESQSRKVADMLAADRKESEALGVNGTPYLFVDDLVIPGAPDKTLLRSAVNQAMRLKKKS